MTDITAKELIENISLKDYEYIIKISKKDLEEAYSSMRIKDLLKALRITNYQLNKLLKEYKIKTKKEIKSNKRSQKQSNNKNNKINEEEERKKIYTSL
ncbi:MAG: hypothetical protein NZZ41_04245 [Candidatus Dojkabacteria bacterium]|nr:hypothetical protein [Candidatus Dojkabacteria bacterium]